MSRCDGPHVERPVPIPTDDYISDDTVATYMAKHATKATEVAGHVPARPRRHWRTWPGTRTRRGSA